MGRITIHLECTANWEEGKLFLAQAGVETAFLLNANPEQVQYTLDHTTGIVVVRVYDPFWERAQRGDDFEKDSILRHTPQEYINWLNANNFSQFKGNKRTRFALGYCEMYYNGRDYQIRQNAKMLAIADAMVKAGYGCALFGMATDKTIQMADVEAGVWKPVTDWLKANRDWAHLDVHEYELGRLASQHLKAQFKPYPESIVDPASMAFSNWGTIHYSGDGIKENWHVGRVAWLGTGFPYAYGECGSDYKADGAIGAWLPVFTAKYGKPQGFPSNRDLYHDLMGRPLNDKEFCEEIWKDLSWFAAQDPTCLSYAVFAWNAQPEHQPFNIGKPEYAYLRELMGGQAPMTTPNPIPVMEAKRIRSLQESNIRSAANVTASILHVIKTEWLEGKFSRDSVTPTETRKWHKIEVTVDGKLISGYVAKTELLVVEDLPIVIPPPAPNMIEIYYVEFNGATIRMNKAQWLDAIKSHEFMVTYHNLQAEALKTITPILEAETIANAA